MWMPGTVKCLPSMPDLVHLRRVGVDAALPIPHDGVVLPRALPELVEHLEVLVGVVVALVVLELVVLAHVARGGGEVAGHDVPADPALGEVVERRHATGERVRVLVGGAGRDPEAEVLGDVSHGRYQQDRIADGHLRPVPDRGLVAVAVHVVGAEHVGDEDAVEPAALEELRELGPVAEVLVAVSLVVGMLPHAGRLVGDAVHVEGVEADLSSHAAILEPARPDQSFRMSHGVTDRHTAKHAFSGGAVRNRRRRRSPVRQRRAP